MDLLILLILWRVLKLNARKLFTHYFFVALLGGVALYIKLYGKDERLGGALLDTTLVAYMIFIWRIIAGKYSGPKPDQAAD